MTLTLEWVGRFDEGPWINPKNSPPADALMQLFYRVNLLYAEAFRLDEHLKGPGHWMGPWYRTRAEWSRWNRYSAPTPSPAGPPLTQWPAHAIAPPIAPEAALRFEAMTMASPLDLIFQLPPAVLIPGGAASVLGFIHLLEKVWNAPKRIRLEGVELERKTLEEQDALKRARKKHGDLEQDGFVLREGSAEFLGDWKWPENG